MVDTFMALCRSRPEGWTGPGAIPFTDQVTAWREFGWKDGADMSLNTFLDWMLLLDSEFKLWYEENKPKAKSEEIIYQYNGD